MSNTENVIKAVTKRERYLLQIAGGDAVSSNPVTKGERILKSIADNMSDGSQEVSG